jgi:hypothetical protein
MLHLRITILLYLFCLNASAQENKTFQPVPQQAGFLTDKQTPIQALAFSFPMDVYKAEADSSENLIIVLRKYKKNKFTGKGKIMSMNPLTGSVSRTKDISLFNIHFTKDYTLYMDDDGTRVANKHTGEYVRKIPYHFKRYYYNSNTAITTEPRMIDIGTGKTIWKGKQKLDDYWEDTYYISDSAMLIAAGGLHLLNLNDGSGWDYKLKTKKEDVDAIAGAAVLGLATGLLTGMAYMPVGNTEITGLSSNIVYDENEKTIYYSSLKTVTKLDDKGKLVWEKELEKRESSMASLWMEGDKIIHLNHGLANYNGALSTQGDPFIAAYDASTGKSLYKQSFEKEKGFSSFQHHAEHTLLKTQEQLILFDHNTGKEESRMSSNKYTEVIPAVSFYQEDKDGKLVAIRDLYPNHFFTWDTASILCFDDKVNQVKEWSIKSLWQLESRTGDFSFFRKAEQVAVYKNDRPVANLSLPGYLMLTKSALLFFHEDKMYAIDRKEIEGK